MNLPDKNPYESPVSEATESNRSRTPGVGMWLLVICLAGFASLLGFFTSCLGSLFLIGDGGSNDWIDPVTVLITVSSLGGLASAGFVFWACWRVMLYPKPSNPTATHIDSNRPSQ